MRVEDDETRRSSTLAQQGVRRRVKRVMLSTPELLTISSHYYLIPAYPGILTLFFVLLCPVFVTSSRTGKPSNIEKKLKLRIKLYDVMSPSEKKTYL